MDNTVWEYNKIKLYTAICFYTLSWINEYYDALLQDYAEMTVFKAIGPSTAADRIILW